MPVSNENLNLNPNIVLDNTEVGSPIKKVCKKREKVVDASTQIFSKKRSCDSTQHPRLPLTEKKIVILPDVLETLPLDTPPQVDPVVINPDVEMIERALGGTESSHVERFKTEHGQTLQTIVDAVLLELTALRQLDQPAVTGFGGFKKAGIKQWKFFVRFDGGKITELVIGKFRVAGSYSKVYFTLDKKVILVPKKASTTSNVQLTNAHTIISHLHDRYFRLNSEELEKVLNIFPPLPNTMMIGERPIQVAPQAVGNVEGIFNSPATLSNIMQRLELLRDVATCLMLCHAQGIIHGDVKPLNILISEKSKGILHDFGGGCIFYSEDTPEIAASKMENITQTYLYVHHRDYIKKDEYIKKKASTNRISQLAAAFDVFALGVSLVEAFIGRYDSNGNFLIPFQKKAYYYCEVTKELFPAGPANSRREVTLFQGFFPSIDGKLQALLDNALEPYYERRMSSLEFCQQLDAIIVELKKAGM